MSGRFVLDIQTRAEGEIGPMGASYLYWKARTTMCSTSIVNTLKNILYLWL